jgi:hypothetical protein
MRKLEVKKLYGHGTSKVLMMSGAYTVHDTPRFILMGAIGFLPKPLDMYGCCDQLRNALADQRQEGRLQMALPVNVNDVQGAETVNISAWGAFIQSTEPLPEDSLSDFCLGRNSRVLKTSGRVVRSFAHNGKYYAGVCFQDCIGDRLLGLVDGCVRSIAPFPVF